MWIEFTQLAQRHPGAVAGCSANDTQLAEHRREIASRLLSLTDRYEVARLIVAAAELHYHLSPEDRDWPLAPWLMGAVRTDLGAFVKRLAAWFLAALDNGIAGEVSHADMFVVHRLLREKHRIMTAV